MMQIKMKNFIKKRGSRYVSGLKTLYYVCMTDNQSQINHSINIFREMKKVVISVALVLSVTLAGAQEITQACKDRAKSLVDQMTLQEKVEYIAGYRDGFYIRPVERLGIPEIRMADGPQGVRNNTKSTLFACGVAAAASWDQSLAYEWVLLSGRTPEQGVCISCLALVSISTGARSADVISSIWVRTHILLQGQR